MKLRTSPAVHAGFCKLVPTPHHRVLKRMLKRTLQVGAVSLFLIPLSAPLRPALAQTGDPARDAQMQRIYFTMIFNAALKGDAAVVEGGLQIGANVNGMDDKKRTTLMAAASKGNLDIVRLLLNKGADATLKDTDGHTALDYAAAANNAVLSALLKAAMEQPAAPAPPAPIPPIATTAPVTPAVTAPAVNTVPTATAAPTELRLPPLTPRPGYVMGRAVFPDGRPVPEFTVTVGGFDGESVFSVNGGVPTVGYITAQNGSYAVQPTDSFSHKKPVNAMVVSVNAKSKVVYNGKTYQMDLHPLDGKLTWRDAAGNAPYVAAGLTRDFVLKISGLQPGHDDTSDYLRRFAYYGATIDLNSWVEGKRLQDQVPATARMVFTLTPQGPLLDGSVGQTLTRDLPISALGTEAGRILDIPIGIYSVQAQVVNGGATSPLSVRVKTDSNAWEKIVTVNFPPNTTTGVGASAQTLDIKL